MSNLKHTNSPIDLNSLLNWGLGVYPTFPAKGNSRSSSKSIWGNRRQKREAEIYREIRVKGRSWGDHRAGREPQNSMTLSNWAFSLHCRETHPLNKKLKEHFYIKKWFEMGIKRLHISAPVIAALPHWLFCCSSGAASGTRLSTLSLAAEGYCTPT